MSTEIAIESQNNPTLQAARKILDSGSKLRGIDYLTSRRKRFLDRAASSILSPFALTMAGVLSVPVFLQDGYFPFYGRLFPNPATGKMAHIWKIRSMRPGADKLERDIVGQHQTIAEFKANNRDPRVTPYGRLLRTTTTDELPQIAAAALGKIAFIGPRPYTPDEWKNVMERIEPELTNQLLELFASGMEPGAIGPYCLFGRAKLSLLERVLLDILYGEEANIIGDIRMIRLTAAAVSSRIGAG